MSVKVYCLMCFHLCLTVGKEEQVHSSSCLPNELLLGLFHSSLEHELSDREIPLADNDHSAFMHHILERERDGHVAPFSLPVIKGQYIFLRPIPKTILVLYNKSLVSDYNSFWSLSRISQKMCHDEGKKHA